MQVALTGGEQGVGERRDDAGQRDPADVVWLDAVMAQKAHDGQAVLVGHLLMVGANAPVGQQSLPIIDAHDGVGVSGVDAEQHGSTSLRKHPRRPVTACAGPVRAAPQRPR